MEDKITLDRKAFKALASNTRINILKSLLRRRRTMSELSKQFGMSTSTIKEHLDNLSETGLVVQKDEGHKWKYYELTRKGRNVLEPGEAKIWILLSISGLALILTGYDFIQRFFMPMAAGTGSDVITEAAPMAEEVSQAVSLPYLHLAFFVVFSVLIGMSLGFLIMKRRRLGF